MKEYIFDCKGISTRDELHDALSESLNFPDYYGRNLDALHDCLSDMSDCNIKILNSQSLSALGDYGSKLLSVFRVEADINKDCNFNVEIL